MTKSTKSRIKYLTLQDFEKLNQELINLKTEYTEDVPQFNTRYEGRLEAIIGQLNAEYFGKELYPGLINKAVWLFYCMNKNHPFLNGNKRMSIFLLFSF